MKQNKGLLGAVIYLFNVNNVNNVWNLVNPLIASVAHVYKPVNWFAVQINWLVFLYECNTGN